MWQEVVVAFELLSRLFSGAETRKTIGFHSDNSAHIGIRIGRRLNAR
jgi:hypothetical protein